MEARLGPLWYRLMNARVRDLQAGTVKVTFDIPATGGRVRNYRVISNTAGPLNEKIARAAVAGLRAPPIPEALLKAAKTRDVFTMEESFTTYDDGEPTPARKSR